MILQVNDFVRHDSDPPPTANHNHDTWLTRLSSDGYATKSVSITDTSAGISNSSSVSVELSGSVVPCTEHYLGAWNTRGKSNDKFVRAARKLLARVASLLSPRRFGQSKPPLTSLRLQGKTSALPPAGSPANSNLPASSSPPSSPKSRAAIKRRSF